MIKIFHIADHHFNHLNIIKYENRPFDNTEDMKKIMITNWNNVVGKMDKVFIHGDFAFSGVKEILARLRGYKILIMGNHDRHKTVKHWYDNGCVEVSKYPILYNNRILSHEPIKNPTPYENICGHLHSKGINDRYHFFVSVEQELINYTPINSIEIDKYFNTEELKDN